MLSLPAKAALAARVWISYIAVRWGLIRHPLPEVVAAIPRQTKNPVSSLHPLRLTRIVYRILRVGRLRPRCLTSSLVLLKLLREQGSPAELVIGLPERPTDKEAHAWVEIDEEDVGPPPGRDGHSELVRYV